MKILLLGKNGQVGWELQRSLTAWGDVIAVDRDELDLVNVGDIRHYVRSIKPQVIVNAAAYTDVNRAESEPEQALKINGIAPGILAEEARQSRALLIHYSTDYVFDGLNALPYHENDRPSPLNIYGQTKLHGENAIQAAGGAYLILRTSWVYGNRGRNFLLTILKLAAERDSIQVVDDQIGAPTWCSAIATTTTTLLSQLLSTKDWFDAAQAISGLYHYSASGQTTWYGFAKKIVDLLQQKTSQPLAEIVPISTVEYPSPARRPLSSVLSLEKITKQFGIVPSSWDQQLEQCWRTM